MLFNSLHFIVFFAVVVLLYFSIPFRFRWALLLCASYYFYGSWRADYLVLLIIPTAVNFFAGRLIAGERVAARKKAYLAAAVAVSLGILFSFKYFNFFTSAVDSLLLPFGSAGVLPRLDVMLPVGISFYTFQGISYVADVYSGKKRAERHAGVFALYMSFFPQLVAGPIERPGRLLPQFFTSKTLDYSRMSHGAMLMLSGFFKKLVIADRLSPFVDSVYGLPGEYSGIHCLAATLFFSFQIYYDFSGYTDIAVGAARIMGFDLMRNFDSPYFSQSVREFWQRWHISLSTWFRDYVYIPLGGNRGSLARTVFNLMAVFILSGLWHGAGWTFLVWGALHGALYSLSLVAKKYSHASHSFDGSGRNGATLRTAAPARYSKPLKIAVTFCAVSFLWIFFRAPSIGIAFEVIRSLSHLPSEIARAASGDAMWVHKFFAGTGFSPFDLFVGISSIAGIEYVQLVNRGRSVWKMFSESNILVRWGVWYALIFIIVLLGKFNDQAFIYFQF